MHLLDRIAYNNRLNHRHPAEKAFHAMALLVLALVVPPWPGGMMVMAVNLCGLCLFAKIRPSVILKAMVVPSSFMVVAGLTLAVGIGHDPQGAPAFIVTQESVLHSMHVLLRAMAAYTCLLFLALTTPLPALLDLLRRYHVPSALLETAMLVYTMLFVLAFTAQRITQAQQARLGYHGVRRAYRSLAVLVTNIFGKTLHKARCMEQGLASRAFQGRFQVVGNSAPLSYPVLLLDAALISLIAALSLAPNM
jgi:cobalt/nickel transport system permease protein